MALRAWALRQGRMAEEALVLLQECSHIGWGQVTTERTQSLALTLTGCEAERAHSLTSLSRVSLTSNCAIGGGREVCETRSSLRTCQLYS